jgi:hypothetical protein
MRTPPDGLDAYAYHGEPTQFDAALRRKPP